MIRVVIESPFTGEIEDNLTYLRKCMQHCLLRGEAPFASHALYTQHGVLQDSNPTERELGFNAGLVWADQAHMAVFYIDRGFSTGMKKALQRHHGKIPIVFRSLGRLSKEADWLTNTPASTEDFRKYLLNGVNLWEHRFRDVDMDYIWETHIEIEIASPSELNRIYREMFDNFTATWMDYSK